MPASDPLRTFHVSAGSRHEYIRRMKSFCLSARRLLPATLLLCPQLSFACPSPSSESFVIANSPPPNVPPGMIVLEVNSPRLPEGYNLRKSNTIRLKVRRAVAGKYRRPFIDVLLFPMTSCDRLSRVESIGYVTGKVSLNGRKAVMNQTFRQPIMGWPTSKIFE